VPHGAPKIVVGDMVLPVLHRVFLLIFRWGAAVECVLGVLVRDLGKVSKHEINRLDVFSCAAAAAATATAAQKVRHMWHQNERDC
jgi:hypothetical protein